MTTHIPLILIIAVTIGVSACGESVEDKTSRTELSGLFRQTNVLFRDFQESKRNESQSTALLTPGYYNDYTQQLRAIRQRLAGVQISETFSPFRVGMDSILSHSVDFFHRRQEILLQILESMNHLAQMNENLKSSQQFALSIRNRSLHYKYKWEALNSYERFIVGKSILHLSLSIHDELSQTLISAVDFLNAKAKEAHLSDTLTFQSIVADKRDFLRTASDRIRKSNPKTPD